MRRSSIARPTSASWRSAQAASYTGVHRSLLAGFCTMVGTRGEEGAYLGTRGVHFHIFPGSPLARRRPRWIMAANIVETSRVFARRVAEVEPQWIEAAAAHLVKREYLEPDWDEAREEVMARERIEFSRPDIEREPGGELRAHCPGRIPPHLRPRGLGVPASAPPARLAAGERRRDSRCGADGGASAHARPGAQRGGSSSTSTIARCRARCRAARPWSISPGISRTPNGSA